MLLTPQQNSELLVVELHLVLGDQAALGALSHRVHETHARQHHLLAAALVAEAAAAPPAVVLQREPRVGVRHQLGAILAKQAREETFLDMLKLNIELVGVRVEHVEDRVERRQIIGCGEALKATAGGRGSRTSCIVVQHCSKLQSRTEATVTVRGRETSRPRLFLLFVILVRVPPPSFSF